STASTRLPVRSVISFRAVALVHSVTFGCEVAGFTPHTSASLFAWILQGNELQVLQKTQFSRRPSGSGDGCSPCDFNCSTIIPTIFACGTGGNGYGPRSPSVGSSPLSPCTS